MEGEASDIGNISTPFTDIIRYQNHLISKRRRLPLHSLLFPWEVVKSNDDLISKGAEEDGDVVDTGMVRHTDDLTTK